MKELASKIVAVMDECRYVQKTGKNAFHGYKYATAADVLDKVNTALVKNRIAVFPAVEVTDFRDTPNAKGNMEHLATVKTTLTLVDADTGETVQTTGYGSGQDIGDKAVMKAQTASLKYAWMVFLQISTGDDPEADDSVDKRSGVESQSSQKSATVNPQPKTTSTPTTQSEQSAQSTTGTTSNVFKLSQAQVDRFYAIVAGTKASQEEVRFIQDHEVPGKRTPDGKFNWNVVNRMEYERLCKIFQNGIWKNLVAGCSGNTPNLATGGKL